MSKAWPFRQPQNLAVLTLKNILHDNRPILYVSHDEDDEGWQFLDGNSVQEEDASVVALHEMTDRDDSLLEFADLPPGWCAWRKTVSFTWQRLPHTVEQTQITV